MGDPKKSRRKYTTPSHPYQAERIINEGKLKREFGLSNKKEIWKFLSLLRKWQQQARGIIALSDDIRPEEEKKLIKKINSMNLLPKDAQLDDVLALELKSILDRRLQSQVYKMGLANSMKQARQFILHRKLSVNGKTITSPSYLVKTKDTIRFIGNFNPKLKEVITEKKLLNKIKPKKDETPETKKPEKTEESKK